MPDNKKNFEKVDFEKVDFGKKVPGNHEKIDRSFEAEKSSESQVESSEIPDDIQAKEGEGEIGGIVDVGNKQAQMQKRQKQIEDVLSGDLGDLFLKMPVPKQREFKEKGEETAEQINVMLDSAKFNIKKVVDLIRKWLMVIPGINKYFLEQETKIKADEILRLRSKKI